MTRWPGLVLKAMQSSCSWSQAACLRPCSQSCACCGIHAFDWDAGAGEQRLKPSLCKEAIWLLALHGLESRHWGTSSAPECLGGTQIEQGTQCSLLSGLEGRAGGGEQAVGHQLHA